MGDILKIKFLKTRIGNILRIKVKTIALIGTILKIKVHSIGSIYGT
jgi:hypothetical protein